MLIFIYHLAHVVCGEKVKLCILLGAKWYLMHDLGMHNKANYKCQQADWTG